MEFSIAFQTPEDAWLQGLTQAVALTVPNGRPMTREEFQARYQDTWPEVDFNCNLNRDQPHGIWHIVGWRMGIYLVLMTEWDIALVNDDTAVAELWASIMEDDPETVAATVAEPLQDELGIDVVMLGAEESRFFKRYQH